MGSPSGLLVSLKEIGLLSSEGRGGWWSDDERVTEMGGRGWRMGDLLNGLGRNWPRGACDDGVGVPFIPSFFGNQSVHFYSALGCECW